MTLKIKKNKDKIFQNKFKFLFVFKKLSISHLNEKLSIFDCFDFIRTVIAYFVTKV
jgi:hypothetical protein